MMLQMHERKGLHPKKFDSWEMMTSALAFSWEINQPRVNRLLTTPVLLQEGSGLATRASPLPTFLTFSQTALFMGVSLR